MSAFGTVQNNNTASSQIVLNSLWAFRYAVKTAKNIHRFHPHIPYINLSEKTLGRLEGVSRFGTPLKVAIAGTYLGIGIMKHNAGMVAGSIGITVGSIAGGMAAGAATGAIFGTVVGAPSGPGALATGLVLGVVGSAVGGYYGEKVARHYLTKTINDLTGWDKKAYHATPRPASVVQTRQPHFFALQAQQPHLFIKSVSWPNQPMGRGGLRAQGAQISERTQHMPQSHHTVLPRDVQKPDPLRAVGCHKVPAQRVHCKMPVPQH